jgi:hypothetical protein
MEQAEEPQGDRPPVLVRSDAWLLAALTEARQGRPLTLAELMNDADWLNRLVPTYDELSYGLPRLIAAGYVVISSQGTLLRLQPTTKARELRKAASKEARALGVLEAVGRLAGAQPYPNPEAEDRSLGRLPGLSQADVDEAFRNYTAWLWPQAKLLLAASRLVRRLTLRR